MHRVPSPVALALSLTLVACDGGDDTPPPDGEAPRVPGPLVEEAPLQAGAAEGTLELPVGTPLAGFTSRCGCLGGTSKQDDRDSHYSAAFVESTGVHIQPTIKALWLTNDNDHLVVIKTDTIYSFDGLVSDLTTALEEATGQELSGNVMHAANHVHASYGTWSKHRGLFLGHDRFHEENYRRTLDQLVSVALEAWERREDAAVGIGLMKDWDPQNRVYSDRRGINNDLVVWEDMGPEQGGKDPWMQLVRVDSAAGDPIAVVTSWGMHPLVFGESDPLATAGSTALVEAEVVEALAEDFPDRDVVAMFLQSAGGDQSVRGRGDGWERMETVGAFARDAILDMRDATVTTTEPVRLQTTSRSVPMSTADVHVTRGGTVDWRYPTFDPAMEESYMPDDVVYDGEGGLDSAWDEWFTDYGAVFCGSGDFDFPVGKLNGTAYPYTNCMKISLMKSIVEAFFAMTPEQASLPLEGMSQTYTGAARLGTLPVTEWDVGAGTEPVTQDEEVLMGFFPGEALHMYVEQWRRRVRDELGYPHPLMFSYSMDHEGYLLIPEDWLLGEYEADITFQGPLAGEYIMESVISYADEVLTLDDHDPYDHVDDVYAYDEAPWPGVDITPDTTPDAGTRLGAGELPRYFWTPRGFDPRPDGPGQPSPLTIPEEVPRAQQVLQLAWIGGDPGVDHPEIRLERQDEEGAWAVVTSRSGRAITNEHHDIVMGYTPDPLFPASADQVHYWWAAWQPVGHIHDRPGLPEGTYRLTVEGSSYAGGNTWPYDTDVYTFSTEPFEIVPADLTVTEDEGGWWVSLRGPDDGFRLIDLDGDARGDNPVQGPLTVTWVTADGGEVAEIAAGAPQGGRTWLQAPADEDPVLEVVVEDRYGNVGSWTTPR